MTTAVAAVVVAAVVVVVVVVAGVGRIVACRWKEAGGWS